MKPVFEVLVPFEKHNLHRVAVTLYRSRADMVRAMRRDGHKKAAEADASCFQHNCLTFFDNRIAHMHFCRDRLTAGNIAHECFHTVHHRMRLLGMPPDHEDYEERVATETGELVDALMRLLHEREIAVMA